MSDKVKELRAKAKKAQTEAEELRATITDDMSNDDANRVFAQFETIMDDADRWVREAKSEERAARAMRDAEETREREERQARDARRPGQDADAQVPGDQSGDQYREAFREYLAAGAIMADVSAESRGVLSGARQEFRAQAGATGPAGGYLVPTTLAGFINVAMAAHGPMMDPEIATEINLPSGAPFDLPKVDDTEQEAAAHAENAEPVDDGSGDIVLGKDTLNAYMLITPWIRWSYELAQDSSFAFEALLGKLIGERLGRMGNKWLTIGSGTAQPQGFVTGALVGRTAAAQTAITFDDILHLEHSVEPAYRNNPKVGFQMHDDTILLLRKIKKANGDYIWSEGNVTAGVPQSLNGKPVRFNQAMATVAADAKPIAFGDFGEYYVRKVGDPVLGTVTEKFWPNLGIAGVHRIDGALATQKALKVLQMAAA
jgi:HK97 family phage major capsid protein